MMNAVVKPYHEMCLNSSELIVPRDTRAPSRHWWPSAALAPSHGTSAEVPATNRRWSTP